MMRRSRIWHKFFYNSVVGYLTYDIICTRSGMAEIASQISKYMSNVGKDYWNAVKWIIGYLVVIIDCDHRFSS